MGVLAEGLGSSGTWAQGSRYSRTGVEHFSIFTVATCPVPYLPKISLPSTNEKLLLQRDALMPRSKEAPISFLTATEVPMFCKYSSKPHKGPWSTHRKQRQLQLIHTDMVINGAECAVKANLWGRQYPPTKPGRSMMKLARLLNTYVMAL